LDHDHYCDYQSGGCGASAGIGPAVTVTAKGNIAYFTDAQYLPGLSYMNNPGLDSNSVAHDLTVTTVADDLVALRRTGPATVQARVQYGRPVGGPLYSIRANYTDDGTSFPRYGKAVYTVGHYTDSLGTLAGGTHTTEAGTKSLGQFLGGDLLQLAAPTRPPFGAWLRYRYVGGQLTTQELWPWPMNDRIKAAMVQSGYAAKGGLDGAGETDLTKLIFALAGASTAPVRPLLLAAWPFDGDSGTTVTDTTGNGHTGTLLAGASLGPGRLGAKAVYFDGITSGVQMAGLLGQPAAVSLDTWFKVDTAATPAKLISIGDYLSLFVTTTQIYSLYWDGARQQQTAWNVNYVGAGWHHAVAVIDPPRAMQNLYVDGVLRATTTLSNPIVYSSGGAPDTFLGRHSANNKYNFVGAMDEVQISNYALTEAEATARYQRGVSASWPFDGDTGTTATDTTGNGHTGTLLTGASFGAGFIGAQALLFDGTTSGMQVSGVFGQLPTLSVDLWVRVDSVDSTTQTAKLISIGDYINIVVTPTQLMSTYWDGSRQQQTPYGAPYIGTGWHHVVAVVDPPHAVQKLYVDGTLRAQTTLTNPIIYTGGAPDTFLGRHGLNNKYNFVGAVDEVQISNYALTQAEVTARYQRGH
jgi:hypothetical protein